MAALRTSTRTNPPHKGEGQATSVVHTDFFQEKGRVQRLDLLRTLLSYGHSPLILIGPTGAGKTTLLQQLQKHLAHLQPTARLVGYPELEVDPLLDEVQRQFTAALATGRLESAMGAVMLVDDADTLADVVLQVLLTPSPEPGGGQVRVLLAGTPRLAQRIAPMVASTLPMPRVFELLPFSEEDSARFVRSRFAALGIHTHPALLPASLQQVHQGAGGWPGALVSRAQTLLGATAVAHTPKTATPKPVPSAVPTASATQGVSRRFDPLTETFRQVVRSQWSWPILGILGVCILLISWPQKKPPIQVPTNLSTLAPPPVHRPETVLAEAPARPESAPSAAAPLTIVATAPPLALPTNRSSLAIPHTEAPPVPKSEPLPPIAHPEATLVPSVPKTEPNTPVVHPEVAATPTPKVAQPLPTTAVPTTVATVLPPTPPVAATSDLHGNEWLRAQPPTHYTLQLMSGNAEEPVQEFIRHWGINPEKAIIAHTRRNGHDWYVLLFGVYENQRKAEEATKQLPHGVDKPWMRALGGLQPDLIPQNLPKK